MSEHSSRHADLTEAHDEALDGGLARGVLGLRHLTATSLANMAPALGLYFTIALLANYAGLASPFAVLLGVMGLAGTAFTLASFSQHSPSVGSFVNYIQKGFGTRTGITSGVTLQFGYLLLNAATVVALGSWTESLLSRWAGVDVPWQLLSIVFAAMLFAVMIVGVKANVHGALILFAFEVTVLLILAALILFKGPGFSTAALTTQSPNGASGIGVAFVFSLYMFIGWEAPVAFTDETINPKRNVPLAIVLTLAIGAVLYTFLTYVAVVGFDNDVTKLAADPAPFDTLASLYGNQFLRFAIDLAGFTSICGSLLASAASQGRILFDMGRVGMLPKVLGGVQKRYRTPYVALLFYYAFTVVVVLVWGHFAGDATSTFGQVSSLGTIPVAVIYLLVNAAGIAYSFRHPDLYWNRHLGRTISLIGLGLMTYPIWSLVQPGQAAPLSYWPWIVLAIALLALLYSSWLLRKRPEATDRITAVLAE